MTKIKGLQSLETLVFISGNYWVRPPRRTVTSSRKIKIADKVIRK